LDLSPAGLGQHAYSRLAFLPGAVAIPLWAKQWTAAAAAAHPSVAVASHGVQTASGRERRAIVELPPFPETGLGGQLRAIAETIVTGAGRSSQVFFCSLGGFDTHSGQNHAQAGLYRELSEAVGAFYQALEVHGLSQSVTLATAPEFNRTLARNERGGTDHAWAGHRLVVGGNVLGGEILGGLPNLKLGGAADVTGTGVWRPTLSEERFDATLAYWLGASAGDFGELFPGSADSLDPAGFLA